jgi:basic membrane protein A
MSYRSFLKLMIPILALGMIAGCAKQAPKTDTGKIKAAVVTDVGGIGDLSFNAMAWSGLQRAGKDLGIDVKFLESKEQADYAMNLRRFAEQGYDLVFAVGSRTSRRSFPRRSSPSLTATRRS